MTGTNHYEIYQMDEMQPTIEFRYADMETALKHGFQVKRQYYNKVYEGELPADEQGTVEDMLDAISIDLSIGELPEGYRGKEMMTGDVIALSIDGEMQAYYLDDLGYVPVEDFFDIQAQRAVRQDNAVSPESVIDVNAVDLGPTEAEEGKEPTEAEAETDPEKDGKEAVQPNLEMEPEEMKIREEPLENTPRSDPKNRSKEIDRKEEKEDQTDGQSVEIVQGTSPPLSDTIWDEYDRRTYGGMIFRFLVSEDGRDPKFVIVNGDTVVLEGCINGFDHDAVLEVLERHKDNPMITETAARLTAAIKSGELKPKQVEALAGETKEKSNVTPIRPRREARKTKQPQTKESILEALRQHKAQLAAQGKAPARQKQAAL